MPARPQNPAPTPLKITSALGASVRQEMSAEESRRSRRAKTGSHHSHESWSIDSSAMRGATTGTDGITTASYGAVAFAASAIILRRAANKARYSGQSAPLHAIAWLSLGDRKNRLLFPEA